MSANMMQATPTPLGPSFMYDGTLNGLILWLLRASIVLWLLCASIVLWLLCCRDTHNTSVLWRLWLRCLDTLRPPTTSQNLESLAIWFPQSTKHKHTPRLASHPLRLPQFGQNRSSPENWSHIFRKTELWSFQSTPTPASIYVEDALFYSVLLICVISIKSSCWR